MDWIKEEAMVFIDRFDGNYSINGECNKNECVSIAIQNIITALQSVDALTPIPKVHIDYYECLKKEIELL